MPEAESKSSIQVIERMIRLLDALAQSPDAVSLKQLSQVTGLHPSTTHRILTALSGDRLIERVDQGNYRLGMRLLELGNLVRTRVSVREHALPFMREDLARYCSRTQLPAFTRNSITDPGLLANALEAVRKNQYAFDNEEVELGVRCIGAGVHDDSGALIAGLSVSAPAERLQARWAEAVRETAEEISRAIGFEGSPG